MALLDLQGMTVENYGGDDSSVSLLLCDKASAFSTLVCL